MLYSKPICIYCQSRVADTVDHVPPKNMFPEPRPDNLITVPCCHTCNKGFQKDDDYFRLKVGLNDAARGHRMATKNLNTILRSLARPEAEGFRQMHANDTKFVHAFSASGLYVGERMSYEVDLNRISNVVKRTVRGLYFECFKEWLRQDCKILMISDERTALAEFSDTVIAPILANKERIIGEGTFSYRFAMADVAPYSAWLLTFYGAISFLAIIADDRAPISPRRSGQLSQIPHG